MYETKIVGLRTMVQRDGRTVATFENPSLAHAYAEWQNEGTLFTVRATVSHSQWDDVSTVTLPEFILEAVGPQSAIALAREVIRTSSVDLLDVCDDVEATATITVTDRKTYVAHSETVNLRPEV